MTESVENLILEHLRAIRARVEQHSEEFSFLKERMTSIEKQMAGIHNAIAGLHSDSATSMRDLTA
ncbi:MAG: hypothetical protein ABIH03_15345 [Pseudomonadota bacterium]